MGEILAVEQDDGVGGGLAGQGAGRDDVRMGPRGIVNVPGLARKYGSVRESLVHKLVEAAGGRDGECAARAREMLRRLFFMALTA